MNLRTWFFKTRLNFLHSALILMLFTNCTSVCAYSINFSNADFSVTPVFSNVVTFSFDIEVNEPYNPGVFINPNLNGVDYSISGSLVPGTPSGFSSFALHRPAIAASPIPESEFYNQGSSLHFRIADSADLSDGLQLSDLDVLPDIALPSLINPDPLLSSVIGSNNAVLVFNGREIQNITGFSRFHPALFVINSDGTGSMRNSNNIVNSNGFDEISFGSEYISTFTFDPSAVTISTDTKSIPLPGTLPLMLTGLFLIRRSCRNR